MNVLLVGSDSLLARALEALLRSDGHRVQRVDSPDDAPQLVSQASASTEILLIAADLDGTDATGRQGLRLAQLLRLDCSCSNHILLYGLENPTELTKNWRMLRPGTGTS